MGSSTDNKRTKRHAVERWQRLAAQNMGSCAIEQYLQWCQTTMDDTRGTEEYKCDADELLHRYANVYTSLQQIINKKTPEALEGPTAGAQKSLGPNNLQRSDARSTEHNTLSPKQSSRLDSGLEHPQFAFADNMSTASSSNLGKSAHL